MSGRTWAAAGVLLLVFLAVALTPLAAAQSSATEVVVYSPFRGGEGLAEKVLSQSPGVCRQGSIADPRAGAWLCSNFIPGCYGHRHCPAIFDYDPCFSRSPTARYVVCPQSPRGEVPAGAPFGAYVVRLKLIEPLPVTSADAGGPDTNGTPIAIRLATGLTCTLEPVPVAMTTTGLSPAMYVCPKGHAADPSSLDRTGPTWMIAYGSMAAYESVSNRMMSVQIAAAYW